MAQMQSTPADGADYADVVQRTWITSMAADAVNSRSPVDVDDPETDNADGADAATHAESADGAETVNSGKERSDAKSNARR